MTNPGMKCSRCKGPARHRLPANNARFCDACLEIYLRRQVEKAIKDYAMLAPGQRVLVAVSGGKDSLVLWQVLRYLGYQTAGLHFALDLGEFSARSLAACRAMAERLGRPLHVLDFKDLAGFTMDQVVRANRREFCSVCGTLKRHFLNRACLELGHDTIASGHHLDDEAGRLLGNLIRRHHRHLERQWPVLAGRAEDGRPSLARKVKPLCRLAGSEIKAYALSLGLPAAYGKCPRSRGATLPFYQEALELLDQRMPGTKRDLYLAFLREKGAPPLEETPPGRCPSCGSPTYVGVCSACRLLAKARLAREEGRA